MGDDRQHRLVRPALRVRDGLAARGVAYTIGVALTICSALALAGISAALFFDTTTIRALLPQVVSHASPDEPTPAPEPWTTLAASVAAAEATLQSGEFSVAQTYDKGLGRITLVRFDLGAGVREPRLQTITTYTDARETHIVERVTIGSQTWQRQPDGTWARQRANVDVAQQVRALLPAASTITSAERALSADQPLLRWHSTERNADMRLLVDPTTSAPSELHQVLLTTGEALTIIYQSWNVPVAIPSPE